MKDARVLAHRVDGAGEPVLLLNGGMMSAAAWEPIASALAGRFRVVRCDFRGQLLTGGPARATVEENATDVAALLDTLGIAGAHLIGTSFGAEVGMALAALYPARVRSLVAATATEITEEFRSGAAELHRTAAAIATGDDPGALFDAMLPVFYSSGYLIAHRDELPLRRAQMTLLPRGWFTAADAILASLERFDLAPYLPRIMCPTLVLAAAEDRVMPLDRARALASSIRNARLEVVEGSGHVLIVEHPGRFVDACLDFLASLERRAPTGVSS